MQPSFAHSEFWQWFRKNGDRLKPLLYGDDEAARDKASNELRDAVNKVAPGLVLEIAGSEEGEPFQLVVSADGKPEHADAVKDFVDSAPALPGWEVVAFRPRMVLSEDVEIALEDERVSTEDIWFRVTEDEDGLSLTLHVHGLNRNNEKLRGLGASLLAQHAVGERDTLILLNSLTVKPLPKAPAAAGLHPFKDLVGVFDEAKETRYPPPGELPLDPEAPDWQNMQGTMNGSPVVVMLHTGLRPLAGHPDYDRRLTVSIPFNDSNEDGLPATEEEYLAVREIGDELGDALQQEQESLLALSLMTQGRRDLVFYTSNASAALDRLEALRTNVTTHQVEVSVVRDTFWGMYRGLLQAGSQEEGEQTEEE
jgi:hypothetical protein